MKCRHCTSLLRHSFIDLGHAPASNAYLRKNDLSQLEKYYPLKVLVCTECWLVQTEDYAKASELFNAEYAYFSSTSTSWLEHAKRYCHDMSQRFGLDSKSLVIEVASNDGYLLKNFVTANIPCLGIEPTHGTAKIARQKGIEVVEEFFGLELAQRLCFRGYRADLILGNNVYAHVPDINDFTRGIKTILKLGGTVTLEFPHLLNLICLQQFDTIYHEHFSYLSLLTVQRIFERAGLRVWHVEKLPTHGGSLRVFGCHAEDVRQNSDQLAEILHQERASGLEELHTYIGFQEKAFAIKLEVMDFLLQQKKMGKTVAAYGAAAKGNTLLNYCGIHSDLISFVCDAAPAKQGMYMPGSHIPIVAPSHMADAKPDFVMILPWNLRQEVVHQMAGISQWGGKFVTAIPQLEIFG